MSVVEERSKRQPGRPRSQRADAAILAAALELFIDRGAGQTSVEQVAQRAGVTRATVYRRFPDKTALLVRAIEPVHDDDTPEQIDWSTIDRMLTDWAGYLSQPRNRKMLRRLYGAADDYPELLDAYRRLHGARRAAAVTATLERARETAHLPPGADLEIVSAMLTGAILHHLGTYSDDTSAHDIKAYLAAVLRQVGYRPDPG